jgi:hypothetical protein
VQAIFGPGIGLEPNFHKAIMRRWALILRNGSRKTIDSAGGGGWAIGWTPILRTISPFTLPDEANGLLVARSPTLKRWANKLCASGAMEFGKHLDRQNRFQAIALLRR